MCFFLEERKIKKVWRLVSKFLNRELTKIQELAGTLGILVLTFPAVDTDRRTNLGSRGPEFQNRARYGSRNPKNGSKTIRTGSACPIRIHDQRNDRKRKTSPEKHKGKRLKKARQMTVYLRRFLKNILYQGGSQDL